MGKPALPSVPPIPGVSDFRSLLEFVRNGEQYEQYIQRLEALQAACLQRISQVADADDLDALRIKAGTDRNQAAEELRNARETAAKVIADSHREKDQALETIRRWREAAEADIAKAKLALDAERHEVQGQQSEAARLAEQARQDREAAAVLAATGQKLQEEYGNKVAFLKQKMAEMHLP